MKAAVLKKYGSFAWDEVQDPIPGKGEVLISVKYASICGSDQHIFRGEFHPRTQLPLIPGHEFCGEVIQCGSGVRAVSVGDRVAVDPIIWCGQCAACKTGHYPACSHLRLLGVDLNGGFGQYVVAAENMLYHLPDNIPDKYGSLVELYAIGFHANNRAGTAADDMIAVWGGGKVGHSILQAARTRTGNKIFLIDILDNRLSLASDNYRNVRTINAALEDPVAVIFEETEGRGVDVAFESVGHFTDIPGRPNPIQGCIQTIRGGGKVCALGLSGHPAAVLMKDLIWREGTLITSRNSHGEFSEAIQALGQNQLLPEVMLSDIFPASEAQTAFEKLEQEPQNFLKILLSLSD